MSCDCEKNNDKFSIGLFLGVITGALVGSYITKNYSKKDFDRLRLKVEDFIKNLGKEGTQLFIEDNIVLPNNLHLEAFRQGVESALEKVRG